MSEKIYLGAAYYPEDWPETQIDEDIAIMKEMGFNSMRIAEFAWSTMEPEESKYDFSLFRKVVDKLLENDIDIVMCTPSATPPVWLTNGYPDMLKMDEHRLRTLHGGRRHCCSNNIHYQEYTKKIVAEMAKEFKDDKNIIAWQLDNEICTDTGDRGRGCFCPVCSSKFISHLEKKFDNDIKKLNKIWNLSLWSMEYQSFDQISAPFPNAWHHPSLVVEWLIFQSDSNAEFLDMQAEVLRENGVKVDIGTDMMPTNLQQYPRTNSNLDLVMFNHYNDKENLHLAELWMDYIRNIKNKPFMVTETDAAWTGSTYTHRFKPEGFCRANSWLPIALGGIANMYWLWRMHWHGQEIMHGAVLTSCGRPNYTEHQIREVAKGFQSASNFLNNAPVEKSPISVHFSSRAWFDFSIQPISVDFKDASMWSPGYFSTFSDVTYPSITNLGYRPDLIDLENDFSNSKILITSYVQYIPEETLARIKEFIENGGIWVVGPLSNIRGENGERFTHAPYGVLEEWTGVKVKYSVPSTPFNICWTFAEDSLSKVECTALEAGSSESWGVYTEGPLKDYSAITCTNVGKGKIIILATQPDLKTMERLVSKVSDISGVTPVLSASENISITPRKGENSEGFVAIELMNKKGFVDIEGEMEEIISGKTISGRVEMKEYEVLVCKKI